MIRHIKRYLAIRSYVKRLSGELVRRFGARPCYKMEHVNQAIQRGKFPAAFAAYAHAAYCSREDFEAYYEPLGVCCNYADLRHLIARRYLSNHTDFNAETIIGRFRGAQSSAGSHYESGLGSGGE
jgi:hypothetical protein